MRWGLFGLSLLLVGCSATWDRPSPPEPSRARPRYAELPLLDLFVRPQFSFNPATIRYTVTIRPQRANVALCYGWVELNDYSAPPEMRPYRRSCRQLFGEVSPPHHYTEWKNLEPCEYVAFAELFQQGLAEPHVVRKPFTVYPGLGEEFCR